MGIIGYDDLAEYLRSNYPIGARVIEVGIGRHPDIALLLRDTFDLVCTDVTDPGTPGIRFIKDDIFRPDMSLYKDAVLIYSIRPPIDLQDSMAAVASSVGADLIIRPFASERTDLSRFFPRFRCVNYKKAFFNLYQP